MSEARTSPCPRCHALHSHPPHECDADAGQSGQSNVIPFRRNPANSAQSPEHYPDHDPDGPSAA